MFGYPRMLVSMQRMSRSPRRTRQRDIPPTSAPTTEAVISRNRSAHVPCAETLAVWTRATPTCLYAEACKSKHRGELWLRYAKDASYPELWAVSDKAAETTLPPLLPAIAPIRAPKRSNGISSAGAAAPSGLQGIELAAESVSNARSVTRARRPNLSWPWAPPGFAPHSLEGELCPRGTSLL